LINEHNLNFYVDLHRVKMRTIQRGERELLATLKVKFPEVFENHDALESFNALFNAIQKNQAVKREVIKQYLESNSSEKIKILIHEKE
jgi:hypothetical protein